MRWEDLGLESPRHGNPDLEVQTTLAGQATVLLGHIYDAPD